MNLKHIQKQITTPQGGVDIQFNYDTDSKQIVWLHFHASYKWDVPTQPRIESYNGVWHFAISYPSYTKTGDIIQVTDYLHSELIEHLIKVVFDMLKDYGIKDSIYC